MLGALIISIIAGLLTPMAGPSIERTLEGILLNKVDIKPEQSLVLSFVVCMLGASVVIVLFGSSAPPFLVILGGGIGFFGKEIYAVVMKQVSK